jgi:hypothetical protein
MVDIEGHKHTGHLCYWCGHHEYQEANPVSEKEPTPTDPIPAALREGDAVTNDICAHYDERTQECLFATRNWSVACNPRRCVDCPDVRRQS